MFVNEGSLVEVPFVEHLFLGIHDVKSMISKSHGIRTNDMQNVMFYMQFFIFYVQDFMCCLQYDKYDDTCYSQGTTFLIKIWEVHSLS